MFHQLLLAEAPDTTYPIQIDFLRLADDSPDHAERLLQRPKAVLEELEAAILRAQEAFLEKHGPRGQAMAVKEFVRARLVGRYNLRTRSQQNLMH